VEFVDGASAESLGLTGEETFELIGLSAALASGVVMGKTLEMRAQAANGSVKTFPVKVRIDTPKEAQYYQHGGILQYVLRSLI
jgi:aconitate hydratase